MINRSRRTRMLLAVCLLAGMPLRGLAVTINVVDVIPRDQSDTTLQVSEPSLAVDPEQPNNIAISALSENYEHPDDGDAPIFVSIDGGKSWSARPILPSHGPVKDVTLAFAPTMHLLYIALIDHQKHYVVVRTVGFPPEPEDVETALEPLERCHDEPRIATSSASPLNARVPSYDFVFVGSNFKPLQNGVCDETQNGLASVDYFPNGAEASPVPFTRSTTLDSRAAPEGDGPSVVSAVSSDGTVYEAFLYWETSEQSKTSPPTNVYTGEVIVDRGSAFATGNEALQQLKGADGKPGVVVGSGSFMFDPTVATLGNNRVGSNLSIAVDPNKPSRSFIAWGDGESAGAWALHLSSSINGGESWEQKITISGATNPSIAVSDDGTVGLLYQRFADGFWTTSVTVSKSGFSSNDLKTYVLSNAPPIPATTQPMLGDYDQILAVKDGFIGAYCANNTPLGQYFGAGPQAPYIVNVSYQRYTDFPNGNLYQDPEPHLLPIVAPSIDPFFFRIAGL